DQRLALCVHLLDEVEQYDDVADNHAYQAGDAEKSHEPERRMHDRQGDQRADHAIRSSSEYQKRFDGVIELNEQGQVNSNQRNQQNDFEICEAVQLLGPFTTNPQLISGRKIFLELLQFWN